MINRSFARGLSGNAIDALRGASQIDGWWRDLLGLWAVNGSPSNADGLRLAIRDGYLNFYRRGQSVAKVSVDRAGRPQLTVHAKYAGSEAARDTLAGYAKLVGHELVLSDGTPIARYSGVASLRSWIATIDSNYSKPDGEKTLIDGLLDCPQNANVIDLEMALPAWNERDRIAPRMDLVTIEEIHGRLTVVFGEVKVVTDGRIRCQPGTDGTKMPEVCDQLERYSSYLRQPGHREAVAAAYARTAKQMIQLRDLRDPDVKDAPIALEIARAAAGEPLDVAGEATLIVLCDPKHSSTHWETHRARLMDVEVRITDLKGSVPMNLGALF